MRHAANMFIQGTRSATITPASTSKKVCFESGSRPECSIYIFFTIACHVSTYVTIRKRKKGSDTSTWWLRC
jgi:hypothetical protein